ncbi:MAG TPA: hypothetical protein VIE66_02585 [Methylocella sp.]
MAFGYEAFIKLSLVENVAAGLAVIISRLAGAGLEAKKLEGALLALKPAALAVGGIFVGWEAIKGIKTLADHAKELSHAMAQVKKLNADMSPAEWDKIKTWAFGLPSRVRGTTSVEAFEQFGNLRSMFGTEQALKMGDAIARFGQVLGGQSGNYEKLSDQIFTMVKAGDLMGKMVDSTTHKVDPEKLQRFLDLGVQVINATHGKVSAQTWFQMAQQGGPALSNMSDEGLKAMAMAAQAMGGFRSGTAMTSLYQQMIGGTMTKFKAEELSNLGLVGKNYQVTQGGHIVWGKGALDTEFTRAAQKDPLAAVEVMRKALEKGGFSTIETQVPELFKMLGRQTTQRLVHDFLRNFPQMIGERERFGEAMKTTGAYKLGQDEDYMKAQHDLMAAWTDMMSKISLPVAQAAIPIMQKVGDFFLGMGQWAIKPENAEFIGKLGVSIASLGAVFMGAGMLALVAAIGPTGWLLLALSDLAAAAVKYSDQIKSILGILKDLIIGVGKALKDDLVEMFNGVKEWLKSWVPGFLKTSLEGTGYGMGDGAGITKASWGGGSMTASSLAGGGTYADLIRKYGGSDAAALLAIARSEGGIGNAYQVGDRNDGGAYGPFQFNMGKGRLGAQLLAHGIDPRDPSTFKAQVEFMREYGRKHGGWEGSVWHGIHDRYHKGRINRSGGGDGEQTAQETHVHLHLDGREVAHVVTKHQVAEARHITQAPYHDASSGWLAPDSNLATV